MGKPPGCRKSKCRCPDILSSECYAGGVADTSAYEGNCLCVSYPDPFLVRNLAFDISDRLAGEGDPSITDGPGVTCLSFGVWPIKLDWTLLITSPPVLSCKCQAMTEEIEIPILVSWDADELAWLGYTDVFPHQDNPDGTRLWARVQCDCRNQSRIYLWLTDSDDNRLEFDLSFSQGELIVADVEHNQDVAGEAVRQFLCIPGSFLQGFPLDEWLRPTPFAPRAWDGQWPAEYAVTVTGPNCVDGTFVLECCTADCADFPVNAFIRNYDFAPNLLDPADRIELRTYHGVGGDADYVWIVFAIGDSFARYKILKTDFQPWGSNTLDFEDSGGVDCSGWPATVTLEFQS